MSRLLEATKYNAIACARAAIHSRDCNTCPRDFSAFLDSFSTERCEDGNTIMLSVRNSERAIRIAVRRPTGLRFVS